MTINELRERLAERAHASWSHWMRYLFSQCRSSADHGAYIPPELVERWKRQMETPYASLSEAEKQSDRSEADKTLYAVRGLLPHPDDARTRVATCCYTVASVKALVELLEMVKGPLFLDALFEHLRTQPMTHMQYQLLDRVASATLRKERGE